jgi:hypothetical protein
LFNAMALEPGLALAEVAGSAFWYLRVSRDFELFADRRSETSGAHLPGSLNGPTWS